MFEIYIKKKNEKILISAKKSSVSLNFHLRYINGFRVFIHIFIGTLEPIKRELYLFSIHFIHHTSF